MNKHRNYTSAMGIEPSQEETPDKRRCHKGILREMVKEYHPNQLTGEMDGVQELAKILREIMEENNANV